MKNNLEAADPSLYTQMGRPFVSLDNRCCKLHDSVFRDEVGPSCALKQGVITAEDQPPIAQGYRTLFLLADDTPSRPIVTRPAYCQLGSFSALTYVWAPSGRMVKWA